MTQTDGLSMPSLPPTMPPNGLIQRVSLRFGGTRHKELERFLKFMVVGAIGAVIDLSVTNFLAIVVLQVKRGDGGLFQVATIVGFIIAVISNFIFNRYWTYPETQHRPIAPQLAQFFTVNAFGLVIREIVIHFTRTPIILTATQILGGGTNSDVLTSIGNNGSVIIALGIVMFWNFFVNRYWTYRDVR